LATAACFWVLNAMGGKYETNIAYPVRFVPDSASSGHELIKTKVVFNANGSGWELLKRSVAYRFNPIELPASFLKGREVIPSTELLEYITPSLGRLSFNRMVTDSLYLLTKSVIQKKVFLSVNPDQLNFKSSYRIRGKVYLEPDYITVIGPSSMVLNIPDTLNLLRNTEIKQGVDTLLDLRKILPSGVKTDYNRAHLIFEVATFAKKKRLIRADLVDFPDSLVRQFNDIDFELEYYVQEENVSVDSKAKYKIILDYNMRDSVAATLVPVLVDFPDYVRDYTVSPPVFSLKHAK
jgi:hypothetical protein